MKILAKNWDKPQGRKKGTAKRRAGGGLKGLNKLPHI
jgi:hypothetical protein